MDRLKSIVKQTREIIALQAEALASLDSWMQRAQDIPDEAAEQWKRLCVIQEVLQDEYLRALADELAGSAKAQEQREAAEILADTVQRLDQHAWPQSLLTGLSEALSAGRAVLVTCEESGLGRVSATSGKPGVTDSVPRPISRAACAEVLRAKRSTIAAAAEGIVSTIAVSIRSHDSVTGVCLLEGTDEGRPFSEREVDAVERMLPLLRVAQAYLAATIEVSALGEPVLLDPERIHSALIGNSEPFRLSVELLEKAAAHSAPVLLTGERGTGKRLFAHALHSLSGHAGNPFVPVRCGHPSAAGFRACRGQEGPVTLFLDEVAELDADEQSALLNLLETRHPDIRVIAANTCDLERRVSEGKFQGELWNRLRDNPIPLAPLRRRVGDVRLLADQFVRRYAALFGVPQVDILPEVYCVLEGYRYPANIEELEEIIRLSVMRAEDGRLTLQVLPPKLRPGSVREIEQSPFLELLKSVPEQYRELAERKEQMKEICRAEICALERRFAEALVARANGNVTRAAQLAGIDRGQFHRLLKSGA
jgi:DNA-binding NtrC family response regulator